VTARINGFQGLILIALTFGPVGNSIAATNSAKITDVTPHVLVFATSSGNVVASVGPDGALLVGTPSTASTPEISSILASRTKSAVRYVVIAPEDLNHSEGDAGWGRRGAFVAMQEKALERLGGHAMGPPKPLPPHLFELGVNRPRIAFSEVLTFDVNGEAIHVIHQPPGYSDADAIVHFHVANLVYLGEVFPGDGYPEIDPAQGGQFDGFVKSLGEWTGEALRVVPARGNVMKGTDVKAFLDMILTVRDRVKRMRGAGQSETRSSPRTRHRTSMCDGGMGACSLTHLCAKCVRRSGSNDRRPQKMMACSTRRQLPGQRKIDGYRAVIRDPARHRPVHLL